MSRPFYRLAVRLGPEKGASVDPSHTLDRAGIRPGGWSLWRMPLRSEKTPIDRGGRPYPFTYIPIEEFHHFARRSAKGNGASVLAVYAEMSEWNFVGLSFERSAVQS